MIIRPSAAIRQNYNEIADMCKKTEEPVFLTKNGEGDLVAGQKGKRFALTHSRVMIHQPLGGVQGQASDIEITAREIQKLKKELYTIISDHSGQSFDKVYADSDRDHWMTSDEALEYGMIDRVLKREDVNGGDAVKK